MATKKKLRFDFEFETEYPFPIRLNKKCYNNNFNRIYNKKYECSNHNQEYHENYYQEEQNQIDENNSQESKAQSQYYYNNSFNQGITSRVLRENNFAVNLTWNVNAWTKVDTGIFDSLKPKFCKFDDEYKHILINVNGIVKPGQLCAIMGASGSGKTTLLNILNFRNKGKVKTDAIVKINGIPANWNLISKYSGFVQQDDLFNGVLTVREHLTFVTMLKLGESYTREEKYQRVDELIQEVNLVKSEHTIIGKLVVLNQNKFLVNIFQGHGDRLKGLSGGEKRRLAYASEIVNHPPLLFCDEPTSGLDSSMAQSLVKSMRKLANSGKVVICTIHQPSSQTFEMFDTLVLLAEGRLAYMGPSHLALEFFSNIGLKVPQLFNPADHYIQSLAISPRNRDYDLQRVGAIVDRFEKSEIYSQIKYDIYLAENQPQNLYEDEIAKYNADLLTQFVWLFWRQLKIDLKNPFSTKVVIIQAFIVALFLGLVFLRLTNNEYGIQNKNGALFILIMQCTFGFLFSVVNTFPTDLFLVYRESKNRLYSITAYYLVKQVVELPKYIIVPGIMITIVYWMAGLNDNFGTFIQILLTIILCSQVAISCGLLLSSVSPNSEVAIALVAPAVMPLLIFSGFFINDSLLPDYFVWMKYISWFFYTNEICNVYLWQDVENIGCTTRVENQTCTGLSCYDNGKAYLNESGFKKNMLPLDFIVLILMFFILRILAYIILKIKLSRK